MLNFLMVAEDAIRDKDDSSLSIIKVFNAIKTKKLPVVAKKFTIVFSFEPEKHQIINDTVSFSFKLFRLTPKTYEKNIMFIIDGSATKSLESPDFKENVIYGEVSVSEPVVFPKFGNYLLELDIGEKVIGKTYIDIIKDEK